VEVGLFYYAKMFQETIREIKITFPCIPALFTRGTGVMVARHQEHISVYIMYKAAVAATVHAQRKEKQAKSHKNLAGSRTYQVGVFLELL
jgi:hypothetical protein